MHQYVDLSHTLYDGLVTYKGVPGPVICDFLSREDSRSLYEEGSEFHIPRIDMVANSGTYIDCPFHRYVDGKDLSEVGLDRFADLPAIVVRSPHGDRLEVGLDKFRAIDVAGKAVLIHTAWSEHWSTAAYLNDHPFLTQEAAVYLRDQGARMVGHLPSLHRDTFAKVFAHNLCLLETWGPHRRFTFPQRSIHD